jgi:hypothetical protein
MPKLQGYVRPLPHEKQTEDEYYESIRRGWLEAANRSEEELEEARNAVPRSLGELLARDPWRAGGKISFSHLESFLIEQALPAEVLDIIFELNRGISPNTGSMYRRLGKIYYSTPNNVTEGERPRFPSKSAAVGELRKHLNMALAIVAAERDRRVGLDCVIDIDAVSARLHNIQELAIERLEELPPTDTLGFERLAGVIRNSARDLMMLAGKPMVESYWISGTVQHQHGGNVNVNVNAPESVYGAWSGSSRDLTAISQSETTSDIIDGCYNEIQDERDGSDVAEPGDGDSESARKGLVLHQAIVQLNASDAGRPSGRAA